MIPTSAKPPSLHLVRARLVLLVCGLALAADDAAPVEAADSGADALPVGNVEVHAPAVLREGIDRLVTDALAQGKLPGCVVVIGRTSGIVYARAFGFRALLPDKEPMAEDTIFAAAERQDAERAIPADQWEQTKCLDAFSGGEIVGRIQLSQFTAAQAKRLARLHELSAPRWFPLR